MNYVLLFIYFFVTHQLLFIGRGIDRYKDAFNYWLSHSRQAVERSFGMLTQRWGIFWRPFRFSVDRWSLVIMVAMKLHNICIDRNVSVPLHRFHEDVRQGDVWAVHDNTRADDYELRERAYGERRRNITAELYCNGIIRPIHAAMNSRCN